MPLPRHLPKSKLGGRNNETNISIKNVSVEHRKNLTHSKKRRPRRHILIYNNMNPCIYRSLVTECKCWEGQYVALFWWSIIYLLFSNDWTFAVLIWLKVAPTWLIDMKLLYYFSIVITANIKCSSLWIYTFIDSLPKLLIEISMPELILLMNVSSQLTFVVLILKHPKINS